MYKISNLTNSTIPLRTISLSPKETRIFDKSEFDYNSDILVQLELKRCVNIFPMKEKIKNVEQEVTPSTSKSKRGRKSKSNKGD